MQQSKQGGARVRLPPPLAFLAMTLIGIGLSRYVQTLVLPIPGWVRGAAGLALIAVGAALVASAIGPFKRTGQDPAPWTPSPSLIVEGPYRRTRNPMYLAMTCIQIGIGFALNNLWVLLLASVSLMIVHFTAVVREEAYLTERFGEDYVRYKRTVRRYL